MRKHEKEFVHERIRTSIYDGKDTKGKAPPKGKYVMFQSFTPLNDGRQAFDYALTVDQIPHAIQALQEAYDYIMALEDEVKA